ncbi:anthranilate synthase, component II [Desulfacinum hydrothermale DSM 13146]|uniref:Anthranilate synthase, component II n=1 Tax=Desulfacinum hydrothermale DSM 13146 TaxID=1121390 RepID=A0A1W1XSB4_9BACT|nr:aminodeoxychorismate/anthranilate synthase component II [Desulfacinum hydrothermale]SMC26786.1 anthranilate synthase, component II [Desulfacinum hydrothermale DSM 13146]
MIAVIDNYDSFTYNLVQYLRMLGAEVRVVRNDAVSVGEVLAWKPRGIVISPGPGRPEKAGISVDLVRAAAPAVPILGVCLGHQAIAVAFGGRVGPARSLMHGKTSRVSPDGRGIYRGLQKPFQAMRYHSLAVDPAHLPPCLEVSAQAEDGEIMGIRHKEYPCEGIQFHPESIMTPVGKRLLRNFVNGG